MSRTATSLRELVVAQLRGHILDGTFAPGQKLVERDLCEQLEVSRTLLREALRQLQADGLVDSVAHRGLRVSVITEHDARSIYRVRELLEAEAGKGFAVNASPAQLAQLASDVDVLRATAPDDVDGQLAAKNRFYATLLAGCGNDVIAAILVQLNNRTTLLRRLTLAHPGRWEQTTAELAQVVDACRRGDGEAAARLCGAHVARAAAIALAACSEHEQTA